MVEPDQPMGIYREGNGSEIIHRRDADPSVSRISGLGLPFGKKKRCCKTGSIMRFDVTARERVLSERLTTGLPLHTNNSGSYRKEDETG